ncbi:tripartite motif-containing protein 5-like isoform X2 [Bos indicus]|uniref:Tripartite motif-containing protein 5-like isoform X2 n=1 Tax=Bos indicus TaxID=9915 RepID=A0ABM4TIK4_BOSIN
MASGILMNIQEEVTCPICLELLTEPLSLDCGHTFCQACITANNKESIVGQEGKRSCPVCRVSFEPGNLRPNRHLANIVQRLREVKVSPEVEQERNLCAHHGEKLQLFCEQDGKVICWLCERSQEHRGHNTFLMEDIAPEYQKKLQSCLQRLKGKKQEAEELEIKVREEMSTWKDANVIIKRSETLTLKKPKSFPKEQRRVFRAPDLKGILRVINELTDVQRYWVQVTLNSPKSADVVISPDQRQVRHAFSYQCSNAYWNDNFEDFGVLGSPVITSGRHYWEVDVSKKHAWILGVCGEKCENIMTVPSKLGNCGNGNYPNAFSVYQPKNRNCGNSQNVYSRYQPKNGYWVIGLKRGSVYNAFESSFSGPVILPLSLSVSPQRVGVFLDYEARTVLFLNVTNHGFPIYTFSSCSFPQNIVPYFNPMNCGAPMTLCSPSC